jgi:hypothetical protein
MYRSYESFSAALVWLGRSDRCWYGVGTSRRRCYICLMSLGEDSARLERELRDMLIWLDGVLPGPSLFLVGSGNGKRVMNIKHLIQVMHE